MADDIAGHSIVDLTYGLESVLTQTVTDWEMWIGEACTDETESVVRGFADPRIHFLNLPRQTGDQAGPNNEGLRLFRGRYIADLNHDDLWLPDHLAVGVDALQQTGADLVWPLIVKRHTDGRYTCDALNDPPTYAPRLVVAGLALGPAPRVRGRDRAVGATTRNATPRRRAHRAGKDLRHSSRFTAVLLPSGGRPGAYAKTRVRGERGDLSIDRG
jgi:glycosyltransferase involved in cell wall biosynthesis